MTDTINALVREHLQRIAAQREKFLEAWYAETLVPPSEAVLMQQTMGDGTVRMWVEAKPDGLPKPKPDWPMRLPRGV